MRILLLTLFLTGCATGDWADYHYGPGDWLNDNTLLTVDTMYNYEHLVEPNIEIHYVESVAAYCGSMWVQGCADLRGDHCDIYVGKVASRDTIAHEERHCRGWTHYQPKYEMFMSMNKEFQNREVRRARLWYPREDIESTVAMVPVRHN